MGPGPPAVVLLFVCSLGDGVIVVVTHRYSADAVEFQARLLFDQTVSFRVSTSVATRDHTKPNCVLHPKHSQALPVHTGHE